MDELGIDLDVPVTETHVVSAPNKQHMILLLAFFPTTDKKEAKCERSETTHCLFRHCIDRCYYTTHHCGEKNKSNVLLRSFDFLVKYAK